MEELVTWRRQQMDENMDRAHTRRSTELGEWFSNADMQKRVQVFPKALKQEISGFHFGGGCEGAFPPLGELLPPKLFKS